MIKRSANTTRFETSEAGKEFSDELAGVLTAISIVSRRLARRLEDLDEITEKEGACTESEGRKSKVCENSDQGHTV